MIKRRNIEEFAEDELNLEVRKSVNLAKVMAINNAKYGDGFIFDTYGSIVGYVPNNLCDTNPYKKQRKFVYSKNK